jgi:hypothetical protein
MQALAPTCWTHAFGHTCTHVDAPMPGCSGLLDALNLCRATWRLRRGWAWGGSEGGGMVGGGGAGVETQGQAGQVVTVAQ